MDEVTHIQQPKIKSFTASELKIIIYLTHYIYAATTKKTSTSLVFFSSSSLWVWAHIYVNWVQTNHMRKRCKQKPIRAWWREKGQGHKVMKQLRSFIVRHFTGCHKRRKRRNYLHIKTRITGCGVNKDSE